MGEMKSKYRPGAASIAVVLLAVILLISADVAAALLIARHSLDNDFTAGENISSIEEKFDEYEEFKAGETYEKNVAVRNEGSVDCYVRVFAEVEDPIVSESLKIDFNDREWTEKQSDGFYYYRKVLRPGEATEPLFTQITAAKDIDSFRMICYSETVQAEGSTDSVSAFRGR